MGTKFIKSLIGPYLRINMAVLLLFSLALLFFSRPAGLAAFAVVGGLALYYKKMEGNRSKALGEYAKSITEEMDDTTRHFITKNPLPLCMIDQSGEILWINKKFAEIFDDVEMFSTNIKQVTNVKHTEFLCEEDVEKHILVTHGGKTFRVMSSMLDDGGNTMLYWLDVTSLETLKTLYKDERICLGYINVDNYDDLLASSPPERKSSIAAEIDRTVRQWGQKNSISITQISKSKYIMILEVKQLERLEANKFPVLNDVHGIETDADFPVSLSIGVGAGGKNPMQSDEYAGAALDLALGRGGDQAVVKKVGKVEYYGGTLQTVEKRNKGKSRIMAHALRQLIDNASNVIIMGHKGPDMDCFGAALGVYHIARNRNKEAVIVINSFHESLQKIYDRAVQSGSYKFAGSDGALSMIEKETVLIVVDTHRPGLTECPDLLYKTDKIVVIDHHRRSEDCIENPTLTYMESYASSTSELVTEILQYIGEKKDIDKLEAEALLAGITVDTKNFSVKTGVRTFEAATWLRRMGADTANVRQLFQTDIDFYRKRAALIASAQTSGDGAAYSWTDDSDPNMQILAAQTADSLLDIEGIKVSFVAGLNKEGITVISGRSLGEINVQTVLEKMGGGGHLTTAGAQVDVPPEEAIEQIRQIMDERTKEK